MRRLIVALACAAALAPAAARAQDLADYDYENLSFRGVGFAYGRIWPNRVEPTGIYTLRADLGYFGPALRIAPSISYWSSTFRRRELAEMADKLSELPALQDAGVVLTADDLGTIRWSDLSIGLDAHVVWTAPFSVLGYLGTGIGVHALNGRGDAIAHTFVEDLLDNTTAGVSALAGLEFQPVPRFRLFGEARYTIISDARYPELKIGGTLMVPANAAAQGDR
jgi:hypothetical protein